MRFKEEKKYDENQAKQMIIPAILWNTGEQGKDFRKEEEAVRQNDFCGQEKIMPWCFFITARVPEHSDPCKLICAAGYTDYF